MVLVTVRTPIQPTETEARVDAALTAFFPGDVTGSPGERRLQGADVDGFRQRVWELRIIDAVRSALLRGIDGNHVRFQLNKQGAAGGKVALPVGPHALGHLDVLLTVEPDDSWEDGEALVWWVCPPTEEGEIVTA